MSDSQRWDKLDERLDRIDATLIRNTVTLEEHVRRTNLLESDMKPIKRHVDLINAGAKIVSIVVAAALAAKSLGIF
jgi:hypothetical protein